MEASVGARWSRSSSRTDVAFDLCTFEAVVRGTTLAGLREGLALAQLAPGPLAAQLAIYLGWVRARRRSARRSSALAFILPSFVMVLALVGALRALRRPALDAGRVLRHRRRGHRDHRAQRVQAGASMTLGAGPAAVGALRRQRRRHRVDRVARSSGCSSRAASCCAGRAALAPRLRGAGAVRSCRWPWLAHGPARRRATPALLGDDRRSTSPRRARSCSAAASRSCRSCTAASSNEFHWLTERQFLDAVAVAMITPGPVVITVAFIGYLVAGPLGAIGGARSACSCRATCSSSSRRRTSAASRATRASRRSSTASPRPRPARSPAPRSCSAGARSSTCRRWSCSSPRSPSCSGCARCPSRSPARRWARGDSRMSACTGSEY